MAIYTVHVPLQTRDALQAADRTRFLREGFSWGALAFGPLWLMWRRLWLELFFYIVVVGLIIAAQKFWGLAEEAGPALILLIHLLLGLEGSAMRAARLDRRQFDCCDVVAGTKRDDIERRFFARWTGFGAAPSSPAQPVPMPDPPAAFGILPGSGG